jgi:hypothetical protein
LIGENTNYALTEKVRAIGVVVINLFITITNARRLINMNYKSRSLYYCTSACLLWCLLSNCCRCSNTRESSQGFAIFLHHSSCNNYKVIVFVLVVVGYSTQCWGCYVYGVMTAEETKCDV